MKNKNTDKPVKKKNIAERIFGKSPKNTKATKAKTSKVEKDQIDSFISGKTLEIKLGNNVKFEIISEDEINNLADVYEEGKDNKIITIVPEAMLNELEGIMKKYLSATGFDITPISKYLNSDFLKNILLPYKGMKVTVSDREFMVWKEDKVIVITVETK